MVRKYISTSRGLVEAVAPDCTTNTQVSIAVRELLRLHSPSFNTIVRVLDIIQIVKFLIFQYISDVPLAICNSDCERFVFFQFFVILTFS